MKRKLLTLFIAIAMTVTLIPSAGVSAAEVTDDKEAVTEEELDTEILAESDEAEVDEMDEESVFAEDEQYQGFRPLDVDIHKVETSKSRKQAARMMASAEKLEAYDSRMQDWYNSDYIKVKNQGNTNMCWAFAMTTCAEISYMKETGGSVRELSPSQLAYFTYNHATDPLGGTAGDKVIKRDGWSEGGSYYHGALAMASWVGATLESRAPFGKKNYDSRLAYKDYLTAEGINIMQPDNVTTEEYVDQIKSQIQDRGAVGVSLFWSTLNLNSETCGYFYNGSSTANHAVTAVGWDDSYPKENFSDYRGRQPSQDGAFIIQNSWGSDLQGHQDGYFYLSYDALSNKGAVAISLDMEQGKTTERLFQYDGGISIGGDYGNIELDAGSKLGNVFKVPGSKTMYLDSVGFYQYNEGLTSYDIDIYTNVSSTSNPTKGTRVFEDPITVSTTYVGYNKFQLPEKVKLKPGTKYAIVVTLNTETNFGVDETQGSSTSWYQTIPSNSSGQSFWYTQDEGWKDLKRRNECARIKGYASYLETDNDISKFRDLAYISGEKCVYNGKPQEPEVTVSGLIEGRDYEVSYENNKYGGDNARAIITGIGDYTGQKILKFTIYKTTQTITVSDKYMNDETGNFEARKDVYRALGASGHGKLTYSIGSSKYAKVSSKGNIKGLKFGSTYVKIKAAGTRNYKSATLKVPVKVFKNLKSVTLSGTKYKYTGSTRMPKIKYVNGKVITEGVSYTVTRPEESIEPGTYKMKITGMGNYRGSVTKTYKIYLAD